MPDPKPYRIRIKTASVIMVGGGGIYSFYLPPALSPLGPGTGSGSSSISSSNSSTNLSSNLSLAQKTSISLKQKHKQILMKNVYVKIPYNTSIFQIRIENIRIRISNHYKISMRIRILAMMNYWYGNKNKRITQYIKSYARTKKFLSPYFCNTFAKITVVTCQHQPVVY